MTTRSGFVGLAGRPNVGKSTLVNALVGRHVAIVSVRPQTTRRAIRGVATDLEAERQLVLVDLPGVQRPRDALTEAAALPAVDEVFPISAHTGEGLEELLHRLGELIPEGPYMYPPEDSSDQSSELLLAELIREQVLNRTRQEIPHSVEVSVLEVSEPREEDGLVTVTAEIWAETESQKGILIGRRGAKIGEIGTAARRSLERELEGKVHLDLSVRVRRNWRRDEDMLDRLGIE